MTSLHKRQNKPENIWLNLGLNIILPSILLMKGGGWLKRLRDMPQELPTDPVLLESYQQMVTQNSAIVLIVALLFPLSYGLFDFFNRRKRNIFSIIGFISVLITGSVGLLKLDKDWIAVKEAAIPALFGLAILISMKTRYPLVRMFLYNPEIIKTEEIDRELEARQNRNAFERLLRVCTYLLVLSFSVSAVLNYTLAKIIVQSETGTEMFNQELGKMQLWSYPVIVVPTMIITMFALWKLLSGVEKLTGLKLEDVLKTPQGKSGEAQEQSS